MNHRQSGVALVTAILVVAIATLAATALLSSAQLSIHRTTALRDTEQGWWLARGVEAWVMEILKADANESTHDGLDEAWALPVDYLPVDQGFVRGRVVDQQGLFNLNNLLPTQNPQNDAAYEQQFKRLLASLQNVTLSQDPVPAIRDWMDPEQNPRFPGAEDSVYLNLSPPYRTADRAFSTVSELLAVQGVTAELYTALMTQCPMVKDGAPQPCISALPATVPTTINVNTAPEQVLRSLSSTVDEAKLQSFLGERLQKPDQDVATFMSRDIYKGTVTTALVSTTSQFFQLQGEVFVGSSRVALYSLIRRPKPGNPEIISHSTGED